MLERKFLIIVLVIVSLCLLTVSQVGCGSQTSELGVEVAALFNGNIMRIPVMCKYNPGDFIGNQDGIFTAHISFETLIEKVRKMGFFVQNDEREAVVMRETEGNKVDYFYLEKVQGADDEFIISNMSADLYCEMLESEEKYIRILFPFHLTSDPRLCSKKEGTILEVILQEEELYKAEVGVEEFYNFYSRSGWYVVEREDKKIIIEGYQTEPPNPYHNNYCLPTPFIIQFEEEGEQMYFQFKFLKDNKNI